MPIDQLKPWQLAIAKDACDIAVRHLQRHQNVVGETQLQALMVLMRVYARMTFGLLDKRIGVPLPTGYGKTTSIVSWIVALHRSGKGGTVAVAASKVESLCTLKRELHDVAKIEGCLEGLEEKIGLLHSYRYDKAKAEEALRTFESLPSGFASEPSTDFNDCRPFLLVTHAKASQGMRSVWSVSRYTGTDGKPKDRDLILWDESLVVSDVQSVDLTDFRGAAAWLSVMADSKPSLAEVSAWVSDAQVVIDEAASADPTEGTVVTLPVADEEKLLRMLAVLKGSKHEHELAGVLAMAGGQVRVHPRTTREGGQGGVVSYQVTVPDALKRVVILDASYPVNRLYKIDSRIGGWDRLPELQGLAKEIRIGALKDYSPVEVRFMRKGGGYASVQADAKADGKLVTDVVEVVKNLPADESVLIFTYLKRRPLDIDLRDLLRVRLKESGVDIDARVFFNGEERKRINIVTWGNETSSNAYSHCHHVVLPGVLRLPFGETLGRWLAAAQNLGQPYPASTEVEVVLGHLAHSVYQAASRGRSRSVDADGKASQMTLWLVDKDPRLCEELSKVMPGARWVDWDGGYVRQQKTAGPTKTDRAFAAVVDFLKGLSEATKEISGKRLWASVDPQEELPKKAKVEASSRFESPVNGWVRSPRGRGLVRVDVGGLIEYPERITDCPFTEAA